MNFSRRRLPNGSAFGSSTSEWSASWCVRCCAASDRSRFSTNSSARPARPHGRYDRYGERRTQVHRNIVVHHRADTFNVRPRAATSVAIRIQTTIFQAFRSLLTQRGSYHLQRGAVVAATFNTLLLLRGGRVFGTYEDNPPHQSLPLRGNTHQRFVFTHTPDSQ